MAVHIVRAPVGASKLFSKMFTTSVLRSPSNTLRRKRGLCVRRPVAVSSDTPTHCLPQGATDGLEPEAIAIRIDVFDHLLVRPSSSTARRVDAVLKTSFTLRSFVFSRRRHLRSSPTQLPVLL